MNLDAYLARIGYDGPIAPDLACLEAVHRHHLLAIPYEDLDVQLGRRVDLDSERIFDKIVTKRRGGWCYEMNGLLCWALREIGFEVHRMVGAVLRSTDGDNALGNHLVLKVELDETYLADVGLGDALLDPIPLREGRAVQGDRSFRLEIIEEGFWRFHNHVGAIPPDFDFFPEPDEERLAQSCEDLQDDADSLFRQNLICMNRNDAGGTNILLGCVLVRPGEDKRILSSADELCETLLETFGLEDPEFRGLWPQVVARHRAVFGEKSAEDISFDMDQG